MRCPARTQMDVCSGCQATPSPLILHGGNIHVLPTMETPLLISPATVLVSEEPRTPMPLNSEARIEKRVVALRPSHSEQPYIQAADQTMKRSEKSQSETKRLINIEAAHAEVDLLYV